MSASSMASLTMWCATALADGSGRGQHDAVTAALANLRQVVLAKDSCGRPTRFATLKLWLVARE